MIGPHITVVPKGNGAPRRGGQFVKPHVDLAPMQVQIGFDLSPKGGEALDSSHHTDSHRRADQTTADGSINLNACFLHKPPLASPSPAIPYKSAATSPRSVLQQLLRPALPQSHPVPSGVSSPQSAGSSFFSHIVQSVKASTESPANVISSGPQCKQSSFDADSARKHLDNKLPNLSTNENEPLVPSSHFNQTKGIAVLVSGSPFSAINKCEEVSDGLFPSVAVRATKLVGRTLGKSGGIGATIPGGGFELINASRSSAEKRIAINEGCGVAENVPVCSDKDHETNRHKGDAGSDKKGNATTISVGIKAWKKGNSAEKSKKTSLFTFGETPPSPAYRRIYDHGDMIVDMDFLNSCFLCKRHLGQGEETFMYSGDKAFCSPECRYQQILMDEQKEGRIPRIIRAGTSPVHRDFICSAIVATAVAKPSATAHSPITMNRSNFIRPTAAA